MPTITFVTCWYELKSKFNILEYKKWMKNFLYNINNFYLVIFTNKKSYYLFKDLIKDNINIKVIFKEFQEFKCSQYDWIKNHKKNNLLNENGRFSTDLKLNMLWNEKIDFVKHVIDEIIFDTPWYGWCDIGYFRTNNNIVENWPNVDKIKGLNKDKIYYAKVSNNIDHLVKMVLNKNTLGLPAQEIPPSQISFAGGFFLIHKNKCNWWHDIYYNHLTKYFNNNYLVKDDQIIILDCIINNLSHFQIIQEPDRFKDPWFVFQNFLL
tara:strand:+ start:894 stop:1688 length:795 start_codon:yes stop_codon:yes gene_type:complete